MQPSYSTLMTSWLGEHVVLLTLNRPSVCHAINSIAMTELKSFQMEVGEVIALHYLTGAGERAFCAGADLKERLALMKRHGGSIMPCFRRLCLP